MPRFKSVALSIAAATSLMLGPASAPATTTQAQVLVECDVTRALGANWQNLQSVVNTASVVCFQVPGSVALQRAVGALRVDLRVTRGAADLYLFPVGGEADQLNGDPVLAGSGAQTFAAPIVTSALYNIAVAPSFDNVRLSYQLRLSAGAPQLVPTAIAPGGVIVLPTTLNQPCSTAGANLSNFCVTPYPVAVGGTAYAEWRIPNFRSGAFDRGDGRGLIGPIASQQRVDVPGITAPRVVRVQWTDLQGRTYLDSILIPVSGQAVATSAPVGDTFPCSRAGINLSNLCIEQPYPVRRGTTAYAVWRIVTGFSYGEFDRGDGQGFRGPISAEQRVEIPNITGPRTVRLRWVDPAGVTRVDSFTIQVID